MDWESFCARQREQGVLKVSINVLAVFFALWGCAAEFPGATRALGRRLRMVELRDVEEALALMERPRGSAENRRLVPPRLSALAFPLLGMEAHARSAAHPRASAIVAGLRAARALRPWRRIRALPILVGVAAVTQREADPARAREPLALMALALERAAEDAGSRALLVRADSIRAPRGFWSYPDPCRWLAERFGASSARTEIAEIGVLQTTLLGRAAADIAAGRADVVLVTGGEARHRAQRARSTGTDAPLTEQAPATPDSVLRPQAPVLSERELRFGLTLPVVQYAMLENALRAAEGLSIEAHRREIAALWAGFSRAGRRQSRRLVDGARDARSRSRTRAGTRCWPSRTGSSTARSGTSIRRRGWCSARSRRRGRSASRAVAGSSRSRCPMRTT